MKMRYNKNISQIGKRLSIIFFKVEVREEREGQGRDKITVDIGITKVRF